MKCQLQNKLGSRQSLAGKFRSYKGLTHSSNSHSHGSYSHGDLDASPITDLRWEWLKTTLPPFEVPSAVLRPSPPRRTPSKPDRSGTYATLRPRTHKPNCCRRSDIGDCDNSVMSRQHQALSPSRGRTTARRRHRAVCASCR